MRSTLREPEQSATSSHHLVQIVQARSLSPVHSRMLSFGDNELVVKEEQRAVKVAVAARVSTGRQRSA